MPCVVDFVGTVRFPRCVFTPPTTLLSDGSLNYEKDTRNAHSHQWAHATRSATAWPPAPPSRT
eukprot:4150727-Amphidinium_carterae.1